jgi:hypothetical protein
VSAATPTTLTTTGPSAVGSGKIKLSTPGGTATSAADFFIPPPPKVATDVGATGRMTYAGTGKTISLPAGKIGLVVFDATAGKNLVLDITNITIAESTISISKPDASLLYTVYSSVPSLGVRAEISNLPITGTYTVSVVPSGTYAGNMTLKVGGPDLTVTALTVPTMPVSPTVYATWTFDVTWTVKNTGNIRAGHPWTDTIYLSADNLWDVNDPVLSGAPSLPLLDGPWSDLHGDAHGDGAQQPGRGRLLHPRQDGRERQRARDQRDQQRQGLGHARHPAAMRSLAMTSRRLALLLIVTLWVVLPPWPRERGAARRPPPGQSARCCPTAAGSCLAVRVPPARAGGAFFDPRTGTRRRPCGRWSRRARGTRPHCPFDGAILVIGGLGAGAQVLGTAELFDEPTQAFYPVANTALTAPSGTRRPS